MIDRVYKQTIYHKNYHTASNVPLSTHNITYTIKIHHYRLSVIYSPNYRYLNCPNPIALILFKDLPTTMTFAVFPVVTKCLAVEQMPRSRINKKKLINSGSAKYITVFLNKGKNN